MAGQSPTSDRMMEAREREVQALELRKQGASYRAIGRHLGISQTAAHDAVMRVLARFAAQSEKHTRELRQLEVERLDAAMSVVMPLVRRGDLAAVDRLVRLVDARARLLGLNAPAQVEVGGIAQGASLLSSVSATALTTATATLNRNRAFIPHSPTHRQTLFLGLQNREAMFGGAAGGGKSDALLMAAAQYLHVPGYTALILRRTFVDLAMPDAIMDRAQRWWRGKANWNGSTATSSAACAAWRARRCRCGCARRPTPAASGTTGCGSASSPRDWRTAASSSRPASRTTRTSTPRSTRNRSRNSTPSPARNC
jgi:DNA-binding CsgD family transcriptional regulator